MVTLQAADAPPLCPLTICSDCGVYHVVSSPGIYMSMSLMTVIGSLMITHPQLLFSMNLPAEPPAESWQNSNRPSNTGQSSPTLTAT